MNKPLIFTAALMSAALVAGAAVDAEKNGQSVAKLPRKRRPAETGLSSKEG